MGNIERQLLNSAEEGANGSSGSTLGAKFLANLANGTGDPKIVAEGIRQLNGLHSAEPTKETVLEKHTLNKNHHKINSRNHSGNNRKADQSALSLELAEINKVRDRIKRDSARFEEDKKIVTQEINEIKARIEEAESLGQLTVSKNWEIRLKKAEDMFNLLEKGAPSIDPLSNEAVLKELRGYRHARDKQTQAELKINRGNPEAVGEYTRAQAEAVAISEKIAGLVKEREQKNIGIMSSAQDEGISYTHEQAVADKKVYEEKHPHLSTEGSPAMSTIPSGANPEDVLILTPEGSEAGTPELPREEQGGGIEQGSRTVEDAQINITTEALAKQIESEPTQGTADDWQEEAVRNWESMSENNKVLDAELEHSPEEHNAILPVLTEVVGETVNAPQEGRGETAPETPKLDLTPEQAELVKKLEDNIANISDKVEARAEKTGMDKGVLRRVGEKWNEFPLRYKLLLSAGMLVSGFGAAALGATATVGTIATIGAGIRGFSGAGMFVGFEKMLKDSAEKKSGSERTKSEELRHTVLAASLSILVAGVLPGIVRDYAVEHGFFDKVRELFGGHVAHTEAPTKIGTVQATSEYVGVAEAGDSRWSLAERALAEGPYKDQFNAITSDEQRIYVIDALKDKLTTGMTADQANALNIGDKIDFKEIFDNKDFMGKTFSGAQHLSAPEISNIQNYNVETVMEAPVETSSRVVSAGELLNQPLITDFTPPEPNALTPNEIATPETPVTPDQTLPLAEVSLAHANALVEAGTLKGHFSYSPSGAVDGFTVEGDASSADGHNLLNKHWQNVVRGHAVAGLGDTNINAVEGEAGKLSRYEHILDALKQKGVGASPEADFLKRHIDGIITNTEKTYGHVFKNIGDFPRGAEAVPAEVAPVTSDMSQAMPQEIAPKDPQVLAYIDQQFHNDVDTLFGKKGFLGLGRVDGIKSPHWLDLENRTLLEIRSSTPTGGADSVGINNPEAHKKMEAYLMNVFKESKIQPEEGETVGKYIKRAMEITASRLQTKQ